MGVSIGRNIVFIIILLLIVPLSFGITDSLSIGQTKSYNLNGKNYEVKCDGGNQKDQISGYIFNGRVEALLQGYSITSIPASDGVTFRNLGFNNGACEFVFGLSTDPSVCNECLNQNAKWCKGDMIWSCVPSGPNNCLTVRYVDRCFSPNVCSQGKCLAPSGCSNNNPPCEAGYECVDNHCTKKCTEGNVCIGNTLYHQSANCDTQQIKLCQYGCQNNDCITPKGCDYNNPACSSGYTCQNNQCIQNQQICNSECNNFGSQWCNGNVVYACHKVDGCLKIMSLETCRDGKICSNGQCIIQQKLGCAYHNPDCNSDSECINNVCVKKQPVVACEQGWKCKDSYNKVYQYSDCSISNLQYCKFGCENGNCKNCQPNWKCSEWSDCVSNKQTRTCTDINNCGDITIKPIEIQSCESSKTPTSTILEVSDFISDGYPIIFLHGIRLEQDEIDSSTCNNNYIKNSLLAFKEMQNKLELDGLYVNGGEVSYDDNICPSTWNTNKPISVRASYYSDCYEKEDVWEKYATRLYKVITLVKKCTGKDKVNIVAHSMGGIVARAYIQNRYNHASDEINKVIMLGTPNHGAYSIIATIGHASCVVSNVAFDLCPPGESDLVTNSYFFKSLNEQETYPPIKYYTISTDLDEVVTQDSVSLSGAKNFRISGCSHTDLTSPNNCKKAFNLVLEALKYSSVSNENKVIQESNMFQQPNTPTNVQSANVQQSNQKSQTPQAEKPKQSETQEQEPKKEEPKTIALTIKSWFSRWFG